VFVISVNNNAIQQTFEEMYLIKLCYKTKFRRLTERFEEIGQSSNNCQLFDRSNASRKKRDENLFFLN